MNTQDIESEVSRLLGLVLRRPIGDSKTISRATEPAWDSLKHVEIVFLLEDHFQLRFTEQDLEGIQDGAGLVRLVERKLGEKKSCATA